MIHGRQSAENVAAVGLRAFDSGRGPSVVPGLANRMLATAAMVRLARTNVRPTQSSPA